MISEFCATYQHDPNYDIMVHPGVVYLSQPTEYGGLYTLSELQAIRAVCDQYEMKLYIDGARLLYALASKKNDVSLVHLASLCDAFYIGGTKCGCLFGEAVVIPKPETIPHIKIIIKQHGALLAKGRLLGIQFDTLFRDDFYLQIGKPAIQSTRLLYKTLRKKHYPLAFHSFVNQLFLVIPNESIEKLSKSIDFTVWEKVGDEHTMIRLTTSWATTAEMIEQACKLL